MKRTGILFFTTIFLMFIGLVNGSASEAQLISAAKTGNVKAIQDQLDSGLSIETADSTGRTLLLLAVSGGKYAAASFLIGKGANVNAADKKGATILHILASGSRKEVLELMDTALDKGANINALNFNSPRQTPTEIAISRGNMPVLELLMSKGIPSDYYIGNRPAIVFAYEMKQVKMMKLFADKGANINSANAAKDTILHLAVLKNDMPVITYLVEKKAVIDMKGSQGRTPLFMAVEKGYLKTAEFLIQNGGAADTSDFAGRNIMHLLAAGKNNGKSIAAFSAYKISMNKKDNSGFTPLNTAISSKRWENVQSLIDAGADFKFIDPAGKTLLMSTIEGKNPLLSQFLISSGIDVRIKDASGKTALHYASTVKGKEWDKIIAQIIEKGGNPNEADGSGLSPAAAAIDSGNISGFITLLDNGLNINLKERGTDPIVLYAYKKNLKAAFTELVKRKADISLKDGEGNSMLHLAAEKNDIPFLNSVAAENPDLNIKNAAGKTPLFLAVEKGKLQFARLILDQKDKIDLKAKDSKGMSILHYLASARGGAALLATLAADKQWVSEKDLSGRSPLAIAVNANLTDNADFFLKNGANPDESDPQGSKLLIIAYDKSKAMLNLLLNNNADPGAENPDGKNLFYMSIEKNDIATLKLLVEKNANINKKYMGGMYPLNHAIDKGRSQIIEFLILSGAELNVKDNAGNTPLITAVTKSDYKTVSLLLKGKPDGSSKADTETRTADGKSVILISFEKNRVDIFDLLVAAGASPAEKYENGNTLLHKSAAGNKTGFINSLVKNKSDLNALNSENKTAVMLASEKGYNNAVKALVAGGADIKLRDRDGETALYKSIKGSGEGAYLCAEALVKQGAEINDRTASGTPLLHEAAALEKFNIVNLFLKNGGDPNILNQKNETLIMVLSKTQYSGTKDKPKSTQAARLIAELTSKGSNADLPDKYGRTPLGIACKTKNMIIIEALLKGGANVNGTDSDGNTALKRIIMDYIGEYKISEKDKKSVTGLVDLLIKNGADVNFKDSKGRTALTHIIKEANQKNYQKVADIAPDLISRGAKSDIKDSDGKTANDYASKSSFNEIKKLVR